MTGIDKKGVLAMIKNVGIVGAGSVGSALMTYFYEACRGDLYVLARGDRAARLKREGICANDRVIWPKVYSDRNQNVKIDLLIITVKNYSLGQVMDEIADLIDSDTVILPVQNGITATDRLRERFPDNHVLYGVILRTDAHRKGHKVYFTTTGEMQIGYGDNRKLAKELEAIYEKIHSTGINVKIYDDMRRIQWRKWMLNTGAGQAAVEIGVECGYFDQISEIVSLMKLCMDEILTLAEAECVDINEKDRDEIIELLMKYPENKKMSMLQDVEAGRPVEIEDYAGTVMALGRKHGIKTPANEVFYYAIKAREKLRREK